jgi:predicted kinase
VKLNNTIIYLIGIPAVGKYTVAEEIGRMTGAAAILPKEHRTLLSIRGFAQL